MKRVGLGTLVVGFLVVPLLVWAGEIESLHKNILYPTVRVRAEGGVGSGVIFSSEKNKDGKFDTFVMTNHHVIAGAIKITEEWNPLEKKMLKKESRATVEVEQFKYQDMSQATGTLLILADIMEWSEAQDLALLKLRSDEQFESVLRYPIGEEKRIKIFTPIYVCGAGIGRPPFPTRGEISSRSEEIDNLSYWMINAPIVFGNSGGGTFLADSKQYIGIPSRIAVTFIGWSPNAVYHMGYIIPISRIYKWLEETGWTIIYDAKAEPREEWLKKKKEESKK